MTQSTFPDEITASTLQAMPDAVIAVDVRGLIRFINSRAEKLTGYTSEELHGRNVDVLVPASRRGGHQRNVSDYQHAPEAREMGDRRGLGLRRKDGIIVPVAISLSPLAGSEESIVITTVRDVSTQERRSKEELLLGEIGALITVESDLDNIYSVLEANLPILINYDRLVIGSLVPNSNLVERVFASGYTVHGLEKGTRAERFDGYERPELLRVSDSRQDTSEYAYRLVGRQIAPELKTWIRVPLGDASEPTGHIGLSSLSENNFDEHDLSLLERVAVQISPAIDRARMYRQIQMEIRERITLADIGRTVSSSSNVAEFFDDFAGLVQKLIPFDSMVYSDVDLESVTVALRYWHDIQLPPQEALVGVSLEGSLTQEAIDVKGPILRPATAGKPISEHSPTINLKLDESLKQTLCVPLLTRGDVFGCLYLGSNNEGVFTEAHVKMMSLIASQVSGAIANARLHEARIKAETVRLETESRSRELESLNEQRTDFLSTVSHELKTPLTSLVAFADILSKNLDQNLSDRQVQHIEVMRRSARRLDVLINDLVDVSQLEGGSLNVVKTPFAVAELVDEIRIAFVPILEPKDQSSSFTATTVDTVILADRDRIAQLLTNLMSNASKYSENGTEIEVAISGDDDMLVLSVTDSGIGMDPAILENMFTPFFRSSDEFTQAQAGTGLGLAIVKKIVELHGGTVSATSEPGVGTTVRVELPRVTKGLIVDEDAELAQTDSTESLQTSGS
jgi:PAS domain S-box-containing protein